MTAQTAHAHTTSHDRVVGSELWMLAMATVLLAIGAVMLVMWSPKALFAALMVGLLAVGARAAFTRVRETTHAHAEASSAVASTGLVIAAVAVMPLIAFAALWAGLLLLLGAMWVLRAVGLM